MKFMHEGLLTHGGKWLTHVCIDGTYGVMKCGAHAYFVVL